MRGYPVFRVPTVVDAEVLLLMFLLIVLVAPSLRAPVIGAHVAASVHLKHLVHPLLHRSE
jgi:hypothetical protein